MVSESNVRLDGAVVSELDSAMFVELDRTVVETDDSAEENAKH